MLDSNICSFILRERPAGVRKRLEVAVADGRPIVISVVTYYEMLRGAVGTRHETMVREFVARLSILAWSGAAAEQAARVWRGLKERGALIGGNDTMIAGHALAEGCVLVTNNLREFARVPGLKVEDWAS
jgi:tRNA(fMet)-specific endonuclease VapC